MCTWSQSRSVTDEARSFVSVLVSGLTKPKFKFNESRIGEVIGFLIFCFPPNKKKKKKMEMNGLQLKLSAQIKFLSASTNV